MAKEVLTDVEMIKKVRDKWCSNETDLLGINEWLECYDDHPIYSLSKYNLFDITCSIVSALKKYGNHKYHITFCDCDIDDFENEYSEEDILNNIPEVERELKSEYKPSHTSEYDYSNIHIFEIINTTTPILPETTTEIAVLDICELVDEWVDDYVEDHQDEHDENMEDRKYEMETDIDDYDEDGVEYGDEYYND